MKKAQEHITDLSCELLYFKFKKLKKDFPNFKRSDYIKIINTLVGNYDSLISLHNSLCNIIGK